MNYQRTTCCNIYFLYAMLFMKLLRNKPLFEQSLQKIERFFMLQDRNVKSTCTC